MVKQEGKRIYFTVCTDSMAIMKLHLVTMNTEEQHIFFKEQGVCGIPAKWSEKVCVDCIFAVITASDFLKNIPQLDS